MKLYILFLLFFFGGYQLTMAFNRLNLVIDTVAVEKLELPKQKKRPDEPIKYNILIGPTGLYVNKTFGIHPILDIGIGKLDRKNTYKLLFETRYGHSKNDYMIFDNDTLKSINNFKGRYIGLEYERMLMLHPYQELFGNIGFGYDWIWISKKNTIRNYHIIDGLGLTIGIRYCPYIHKKHGPDLGILYHWTDFNNKGGSSLSNNSWIIRLSYNFARLSYKW